MAAIMTQKQSALSFPYSLLHGSKDIQPFPRMEKSLPTKLSLPPISSLMKDVDRQAENAPATPPLSETHRRISADSHMPHSRSPERRSFAESPRHGLPPTPPLPGPSSFDFGRRNISVGASPNVNSSTQNGYFGGSPTSSNPELYTQHRSSLPPLPETNQWSAASSPAARRASDEVLSMRHKVSSIHRLSYPDLTEASTSNSGLAQQRPLPANFPGPINTSTSALPPIDPQMAITPYQHHHHHSYPITSPPGYPQSTDRYQCPTCQKAFSRPSSLKIHTYSHTGEKPFKCKYEGCGKFFSVRSNMKRHEKGCHEADTSSAGGNSPQES